MNEESKAAELPREKSPYAKEPGLTESIGSFPVWMLKIIDLLTPDFLISKPAPRKKRSEGLK